MKLALHPADLVALAAARLGGRVRFADGLTFDQAYSADEKGNQRGLTFDQAFDTHDGRTVDSTGAFLVGELERLDQTMHEPLVEVSYGRDIDIREDVTIADEVSSFTLSTFGSVGGLGGNSVGRGKSWSGKVASQIANISVDIAKVPTPLNIWAEEIKFSIPELESSIRAGRPIDQQKYAGLQLKHQMDIDEQVYIGDLDTGATGLLNNSRVTNTTNVVAGLGGSALWAQKTPDEILADVNEILTSVWAACGYKTMPNVLGLPPSDIGLISTQKISNAGSTSILKYLLENNILMTSLGEQLKIVPMKFATGAGAGGTYFTQNGNDRMVAYRKDKKYVRFPMTLIQRTPVQFEGLYHKSTYYCRLGAVETVRPESIGYRDGLS